MYFAQADSVDTILGLKAFSKYAKFGGGFLVLISMNSGSITISEYISQFVKKPNFRHKYTLCTYYIYNFSDIIETKASVIYSTYFFYQN